MENVKIANEASGSNVDVRKSTWSVPHVMTIKFKEIEKDHPGTDGGQPDDMS